jgi:type VI protein secretion system component Hcp
MINLCLIPSVKSDVCKLKGYASWFFVETYSLSVTSTRDAVTTETLSLSFGELKITKLLDGTTPQLMAVCCVGKAFDSLSIDVLETSGSGVSAAMHPILKLKFGSLKVNDWSIDKTTETIKLSYLKVACQFSQGKCNYSTLVTSYTDTAMMGWAMNDSSQSSAGGKAWSGS